MVTRVMIVGANSIVWQELRAALRGQDKFVVVGEVDGPSDLPQQLQRLGPDIVLAEEQSGLMVTLLAKEHRSEAKVIIVSSALTDSLADAIRSGAITYLLLEDITSPQILGFVIRLAREGCTFISSKLLLKASEAIDQNASQPPPTQLAGEKDLTDRQLEVLDLLVQGNTNKEIGARLHITSETVKKHMGVIVHKLGARTRTQAVALAVGSGLTAARKKSA